MRRLACHPDCGAGIWCIVRRCGLSKGAAASRRHRRCSLAGNRLAVSARRLAGGPRLPLRWRLCGGEVELYVRPKIGFCNCDTGVADDDEVDRVADLDLISQRFAPLAPGKVDPRRRHVRDVCASYDLAMSDGARHAAVGIAAVASLRSAGRGGARRRHGAPELQRAALEFLASHEMHALDDGGAGRALDCFLPFSPAGKVPASEADEGLQRNGRHALSASLTERAMRVR